MIKVGDRIIAKKDSAIYNEMNVNGIEFEIVEITNSLIKVKNDLGYGIMSMDELSQFDVVEERERKRKRKRKRDGANGIVVLNFRQNFIMFFIRQKVDKLM